MFAFSILLVASSLSNLVVLMWTGPTKPRERVTDCSTPADPGTVPGVHWSRFSTLSWLSDLLLVGATGRVCRSGKDESLN